MENRKQGGGVKLKHGKITKDAKKKTSKKERRAMKYKIETKIKRNSESYITMTVLN